MDKKLEQTLHKGKFINGLHKYEKSVQWVSTAHESNSAFEFEKSMRLSGKGCRKCRTAVWGEKMKEEFKMQESFCQSFIKSMSQYVFVIS